MYGAGFKSDNFIFSIFNLVPPNFAQNKKAQSDFFTTNLYYHQFQKIFS
ncbi:hypothetical protein HS5152_1575 [Enterococcus faecalis]|nr:hypothetical protein HS5152_1575 [Enterococcus faecalis]